MENEAKRAKRDTNAPMRLTEPPLKKAPYGVLG